VDVSEFKEILRRGEDSKTQFKTRFTHVDSLASEICAMANTDGGIIAVGVSDQGDDRLTEVRTKGHFEQWVKFFLLAAYESALDAIRTIDELVKLHHKNTEIVKGTGKAAKTIMKVFNYLEGSPIIDIKKTSEELGISFNAASNAVNKLVQLGILKQTENVQRNREFAYEEYLNILRKDT